MSLADTAELIVLLKLKDQMSGGLGKINRELKGFNSTASASYKIGAGIGLGIRNGVRLAAVGVGLLSSQVIFGLNSLAKLEAVTKQTNTVLKSTKGVAGESAQAIRDLAEKYEALNATIDDKVIQSAENVLLTFTDIRKKAFEPALKAALDMNAALGGDESSLQPRLILVGKALQDPIKGMTALRRVGVNVTEAMQKQIKTLIKNGDLYGAQKVVLAELNKEFGGSFLGQGNTTAGKIAKVKDAIEDLQMALAEALLPTVQDVAVQLNTFLRDPKTVAGVRDLGKQIGSMFSGANIRGALEFAREILPTIRDGLKTTAAVAKGALDAFNSLPPELKSVAIAALIGNKLTGGLVASGIGDIAKNVLSGGGLLGRGASPANPVWVASVGGPGGVGGEAAGAAGGIASKVFIGAGIAAGLAYVESITIPDAQRRFAAEGVSVQDQSTQLRLLGTASGAAAAKAIAEQLNNPRSPLSGALNIPDRAERTTNNRSGTLGELSDRADRAANGLEGFTNATHAAARALYDARKDLYHREKVALHGANQIGALGGGGKTAALVADALAQKFAHSQAPFYKSARNQERTLTGLKALQARFLATGDTKTAARIGRDISLLKGAIKAQKPPSVTVATTVNTSVTTAGINTSQSTYSKYTRSATNDHGK